MTKKAKNMTAKETLERICMAFPEYKYKKETDDKMCEVFVEAIVDAVKCGTRLGSIRAIDIGLDFVSGEIIVDPDGETVFLVGESNVPMEQSIRMLNDWQIDIVRNILAGAGGVENVVAPSR